MSIHLVIEDLPQNVRDAVKRRSVDLRNGKLLLADGNEPTRENANRLIQRASARMAPNMAAIERLKALPDDAGVQDVRDAEGVLDSRSTDKQTTLRKYRQRLADSRRYIDDLNLVADYYKPVDVVSTEDKI